MVQKHWKISNHLSPVFLRCRYNWQRLFSRYRGIVPPRLVNFFMSVKESFCSPSCRSSFCTGHGWYHAPDQSQPKVFCCGLTLPPGDIPLSSKKAGYPSPPLFRERGPYLPRLHGPGLCFAWSHPGVVVPLAGIWWGVGACMRLRQVPTPLRQFQKRRRPYPPVMAKTNSPPF